LLSHQKAVESAIDPEKTKGGTPMEPRRIFRRAALLAACLLGGAASSPAVDCNGNSVDDAQDIAGGASRDCNLDGVPDECQGGSGAIAFEAGESLIDWGTTLSVVAEDLDGDGDVDIAAAGADVSVLLNPGNGRFGDPAVYPIGLEGMFMVDGDIDGDGDIDLIASQHKAFLGGPLVLLVNAGDGTFAVRTEDVLPPPTEGGVAGLLAADLDGDGGLDVAGNHGGALFVCRNAGDGSFGMAETHPAFQYGVSPIAADLDGDGDPDIAFAEWYTGAHRVAVFLNEGGRFADAAIYETGSRPNDIEASDLDGDGDLDLAVAAEKGKEITVLLNRGNGSFESGTPLPVDHLAGRVLVNDLDGDGDPDIIAAGGIDINAGRFSIFLNAGGAVFLPPSTFEREGEVVGIAAPDLNGDGLPEIIASDYINAKLLILENRGSGAFEPAGDISDGSIGGTSNILARDLDGDGKLDLVTGHLTNVESLLFFRNATGGGLVGGCAPFLRGDVNADGAVSISDILMLRRFLFLEGPSLNVACMDAADVTDDEHVDFCDVSSLLRKIFMEPDWSAPPAPFPAAGDDPTAAPTDIDASCSTVPDPSWRLGCTGYAPQPPERSDDLIRIGAITASSGEQVLIPVFVSTSVPVEAIQIVFEYDPESLEIEAGALRHEGTFYEDFHMEGSGVSILTPRPGTGLATAAIAGHLIREGFELPPGEDVLVAWIPARVSPDVPPGTVLAVTPTDGPSGAGTGPFGLRNELSHRGEARLVSLLPDTEEGFLSIVPDQSLFVRGDADLSGVIDLTDAVDVLAVLFMGGAALPCQDAADANDDGTVDVSDPIFTLNFLFLDGADIPAPYPDPDRDPTEDALGCLSSL
jgi:hypothetical protein